MQRLDVIGLGHITCDLIFPLTAWPAKDTKTIVPAMRLAGGGPAANTMATLARLDVRCGIVGRLGDDLLGRYTYDLHAGTGIDVSHVQMRDDVTSPVSVILSDQSDATRTILLTKGVNTTVSPDELDWDWLRQAQVLHFDGHQIPASLALAREAQHWDGIVTMLDAGSMRDGMVELCGLVDYAIASQRFALELTGSTDPHRCLAALHDHGALIAGVTLGSNGCVISDGVNTICQPAIEIEVKDTTGAGDAFHGGFIHGLLQRASLQHCIKIANTVAAIKCTGIGAREALPDRAMLAQALNSMN